MWLYLCLLFMPHFADIFSNLLCSGEIREGGLMCSVLNHYTSLTYVKWVPRRCAMPHGPQPFIWISFIRVWNYTAIYMSSVVLATSTLWQPFIILHLTPLLDGSTCILEVFFKHNESFIYSSTVPLYPIDGDLISELLMECAQRLAGLTHSFEVLCSNLGFCLPGCFLQACRL